LKRVPFVCACFVLLLPRSQGAITPSLFGGGRRAVPRLSEGEEGGHSGASPPSPSPTPSPSPNPNPSRGPTPTPPSAPAAAPPPLPQDGGGVEGSSLLPPVPLPGQQHVVRGEDGSREGGGGEGGVVVGVVGPGVPSQPPSPLAPPPSLPAAATPAPSTGSAVMPVRRPKPAPKVPLQVMPPFRPDDEC
jgi:hypothetical protein